MSTHRRLEVGEEQDLPRIAAHELQRSGQSIERKPVADEVFELHLTCHHEWGQLLPRLLAIKVTGLDQDIATLSGGNQQKVIVSAAHGAPRTA